MKTFTELYSYVVESGEMNFLLTFKMLQDPLEKLFLFYSNVLWILQ